MRHASTASARHRWSDFVALPEDDRRELVDGRLEFRTMPTKLPEYWLVDPDTRTLVVHRLRQRVYAIVQHAEGDEVFRSKTFKGLKVPLAELWSVLPKGQRA